MRLLIVQYGGDYREAVQRFAEGGPETYHAQKYSVEAVADISKRIDEVTVLCCTTIEPYNEVLSNGVRAMGAGFQGEIHVKQLTKLLEEQHPTHLIVCMPIRGIFRWATQKGIRTMALLADSFSQDGLRNKVRHYLLKQSLNNPKIEWIGNHGINSSLSLKKIGVKSKKIVPWDWPSVITPNSFSPKTLRTDTDNRNLIYVGSIVEYKGVGDILESVAELRSKNWPVSLKMAGKGETEYFTNKAKQLRIDKHVEFLGLVPHNSVVNLMRDADLVIVPSRHEYSEGLPMTIYEAFCSRTPIIASNHPMFQNNLKHRINAMIFPAGNPTSLSALIEELLSDPDLYLNLSTASYHAWKNLQIPVKWSDLINRWLFDSSENQQWLSEHQLDSEHYDSRLA